MNKPRHQNPDRILKEIEEETRKEFLPIIGPQKGKVLVDLIIKHQPKKILEVGTLIGYSAILMGEYLQKDGQIITIEIDPPDVRRAKENIKKAGMENRIQILIGDAVERIKELDGPFDLLFLDAEKEEYLAYLKAAENKLSSNAVIVADNAGVFAEEMKDYLTYVRNSKKYKSTTLDFGFDAVEVTNIQ